jgi:hypothetical protein
MREQRGQPDAQARGNREPSRRLPYRVGLMRALSIEIEGNP